MINFHIELRKINDKIFALLVVNNVQENLLEKERSIYENVCLLIHKPQEPKRSAAFMAQDWHLYIKGIMYLNVTTILYCCVKWT